MIDDSEATKAGLEAYLGEKYHILTASNGREGSGRIGHQESIILWSF
jgi:hypothetical protein